MIDAALVQAVFSGLVLVLGGVATLVTARGRRAGVQRGEFRRLQQAFLAALAFIFRLERLLIGHGITPPARPAVLDQDENDDPVAPAPALPAAPRAGDGGAPRHGA